MRKNSRIPGILGKKIQKARKHLGITQEKLAEKVQVTTTYIGFIEQGRYAPSLEVLNKIAKSLGVKTKDIFPF
jgi:DNA-binding XRE family transcriptional regulator